MLPTKQGVHLLLTAMLLVPGALATGANAACSQSSAKANTNTNTNTNNAVASNDSTGAAEADMKKVILNVFGMT